jgi:hypothetical protein
MTFGQPFCAGTSAGHFSTNPVVDRSTAIEQLHGDCTDIKRGALLLIWSVVFSANTSRDERKASVRALDRQPPACCTIIVLLFSSHKALRRQCDHRQITSPAQPRQSSPSCRGGGGVGGGRPWIRRVLLQEASRYNRNAPKPCI